MHRYISKFLPVALLSSVLVLYACDRQASTDATPISAPGSPKPVEVEQDTPPSIIDRILQAESYPDREISKVPLLSIQLTNHLAKQNGRIQICNGDTNEPLVSQYFPRIYKLNPQTYLIEQHCYISTYNKRLSYLIYHPELPLAEVEMRKFPHDAYRRTGQGYYFFHKNGSTQVVLTIPKGDLTPLTFDEYWLDKAGKRIHMVGDTVVGKQLYEPTQRTLWVWAKGRGMGDCGSFARYQLINMKFKVLEYRYQACCETEQECNAPSYRRPPDKYPQIYP